MSDNRLREAFDQITPSDEAKERMLAAIYAAAAANQQEAGEISGSGADNVIRLQSDNANQETNIETTAQGFQATSQKKKKRPRHSTFQKLALPLAATLVLAAIGMYAFLNTGLPFVSKAFESTPSGATSAPSTSSSVMASEGYLSSAAVAPSEPSDSESSTSESYGLTYYSEMPYPGSDPTSVNQELIHPGENVEAPAAPIEDLKRSRLPQSLGEWVLTILFYVFILAAFVILFVMLRQAIRSRRARKAASEAPEALRAPEAPEASKSQEALKAPGEPGASGAPGEPKAQEEPKMPKAPEEK